MFQVKHSLPEESVIFFHVYILQLETGENNGITQ
jgi:hypothetical protein